MPKALHFHMPPSADNVQWPDSVKLFGALLRHLK